MIREISLGLAFLAGLASFLSPCVFSLVPVYISYLSGRAAGSAEGEGASSRITFIHGLAFVLGFSVIFIMLGLAASTLGGLLYQFRGILAKIGGIIVVIFGLHMTGIIRIPFLNYDVRLRSKTPLGSGLVPSFLMGIFFSAGWSPCVGPVLGAILTLAMNTNDYTRGGVLLAAYSAGLAIPFLVSALAIGWVTNILRRYGKVLHTIEIVMGVILIIVGIMLFLGTFEQLSRFGLFVDFGL